MRAVRAMLMAVTAGLLGLQGLVSSLAAPEPAAAQDGAKVFNARCSTCHCVPDTRIAQDAHWLKLITTTW